MVKNTKKRCTKEFTKDTVTLVEKQGYSNTEGAKSLGVSESAIRSWKKPLGSGHDSKILKQDVEIKRLSHLGNKSPREFMKNWQKQKRVA